MFYTLLRLLVNQPDLLAEHAAAYAELVSTEIDTVSALWKRRLMLIAVALTCFAVAVILAGVALMLWAVVPVEHIKAPWALIAVPLLPLVGALWCLFQARSLGEGSPFENVRLQLQADLMMLRKVSAP
jgi:uncharacterized membrane protein YqjE